MAYPIRSLSEISTSIRGAIRQYLPGTDASLKQNVLTVIGKVVALLGHEFELRLQWIFRQIFLSTATSTAIVRLHCAEVGIYQKPAAPASGRVEGAGQANETYPAGVRFLSGDTSYVSSQPFTTDAVGRFAAIVIAERAGAATNRDAGAELLTVDTSLYPGLPDRVSVTDEGLGGGADIEPVEELRQRGLQRKAAPAQGGALHDYQRWALEVPGVVNCWAAQFADGAGTIGTWVLFAGRDNGIPSPSDLAIVQAAIVGRRLVRGRYFAVAPIAKPVDITVSLSPDTAANRALVTARLAEFFDATRRATSRIRPGLPGDPFILPAAWISEVISTTPGETSHTLVQPAGNLILQPGELPVLGTIDWV